MTESIQAWWFEPKDGVLGYGDGRKPEVGLTHTVDVEPVPCHAGLHASVRAIDAAKYTNSTNIWRVEISDSIQIGDDKICGKSRKYLHRIEAEEILKKWSRRIALDVIHLWEAPDVVRRFLETGDESLREEARKASRAAAAASAAARAAAWAAYAADDAAYAAAYAARTSARAAAWDAAWDAATSSKVDLYNSWLEEMIFDAIAQNGT